MRASERERERERGKENEGERERDRNKKRAQNHTLVSQTQGTIAVHKKIFPYHTFPT